MGTQGKTKAQWSKAEPILDTKAAMNFWSSVDRRGVDECWPWKAGCFSDGYGAFTLRFDDGELRPRHASRVAWAFANGRWPTFDEVVMHSCDKRKCCNPRHLSAGTNDENMADMAAKGRASQGDEHCTNQRPKDRLRGSEIGNSKLTEDEVRVIKTALACTRMAQPRGLKAHLARTFGVTKTLIGYIDSGAWWEHIEAAPVEQLEGNFDFEEAVEYATRCVEKRQ